MEHTHDLGLVETPKDQRGDFQRQYGGVQEDAPADLEQGRVNVGPGDKTPEPIRPSQVNQQNDQHRHVTYEPGEDSRTQHRLVLFQVKDVHDHRHSERSAAKGDQGEIKAQPQPPGIRVREIRRGSQAGKQAVDACDKPQRRQHGQDAQDDLAPGRYFLELDRQSSHCHR
ncbi:MAG: hypothetical protein DRN08_04415 [Thermoplasmata archaeon]|nr:MAG: hypothetical protein DRN08_04415 [Thermoplasmata archaeon]